MPYPQPYTVQPQPAGLYDTVLALLIPYIGLPIQFGSRRMLLLTCPAEAFSLLLFPARTSERFDGTDE